LRIDASPAAVNGPLAAAQAVSDETLIGRIAAGDRLAMRALFARHHLRVYRFALRLLHDEQAAEDLIGEVFLAAWRQAAQFEGRAAAATWLLSIARLKALSRLRKRGDEELDDTAAAAIADPADDPEVATAKKQQGEILRHCLARLSPRHREIIDLVYYQGMTIREIAAIVHIPENTVKTRMFHARKQLAVLLEAAGVDRNWP
jgi:RNA polymerase sigma-70 factor (ECF subfamily)